MTKAIAIAALIAVFVSACGSASGSNPTKVINKGGTATVRVTCV